MRSGSLDVAGKLTDDAADADAIIPLKLTASLILRVASQRGVRAQREGETNSHDRRIPGAICLLDKGGARFQRGASRSLFNHQINGLLDPLAVPIRIKKSARLRMFVVAKTIQPRQDRRATSSG